jgi:hypothetical protein
MDIVSVITDRALKSFLRRFGPRDTLRYLGSRAALVDMVVRKKSDDHEKIVLDDADIEMTVNKIRGSCEQFVEKWNKDDCVFVEEEGSGSSQSINPLTAYRIRIVLYGVMGMFAAGHLFFTGFGSQMAAFQISTVALAFLAMKHEQELFTYRFYIGRL